MSHKKMLGLLAVGALAVTSFVGVSSAAAAKVCSTSGTGAACAGSHGAELTTQALSAASTGTRSVKFTSGFITVECDSSLSGEITHEGKGVITSLTYTNCVSSLGACSSASSNASTTHSYAITTTADGGGNGEMAWTASPITMSFTCAGTTCNYTAKSGTNGVIAVTGSDTAPTMVGTGVKFQKETEGSSVLCSGEATWEGSYQIKTPTSFWIT